ncbi:MAG: pyridoxal-phosphate dependent enzyme [Janthinobacterium lividum]
MQQLGFSPDAIFASCGDGGLLSGSYLAKELISPTSLLIGSEPLSANDAYLSVKNNDIFRFENSPSTIADGLKTLSVSARTFEYLKKLNHFYLAEEYEIY